MTSHTVHFFVARSPLKDTDGNIINFISTGRDVTKRVESRKQLKAALEDAKKANQVKTLFLANMSHEIRTPLNAILGFTDIIAMQTKHLLGDEEQMFFEAVKSGGKRLMHTVHEILDISQIEAGTFNYTPTEVELIGLCKQAVFELSPAAQEKNLALTFDSTVKEALIECDEYSITQAISNLIDNAVKYTHKGKIQILLKQKESQFILEIRDTGIGMEPEYLDRLYDTFSQESDGFTKEYQGIGLGMALTKGYLDLNQIPIAVKSKKGAGTTFTLTFQPFTEKKVPIHSEDDKVQKSEVLKIPDPSNRKLSILVVEDDVSTQNLLKYLLKNWGTIFIAESVTEAKTVIKKNNIDLVLLDLSLKGNEDGLDFVKYLRKINTWKSLPVIANTAHAFVEDRERCLTAGCDDYLAKPIKREELLEKIREFV